MQLTKEAPILTTTFSNNKVFKQFTGDTITIDVYTNTDENLIIEAWTNLKGRFHGYELEKKSENKYIYTFELKQTGFFKLTFRYRRKDEKFWTWIEKDHHKHSCEIHVDPAYIRKSIVYNAFIRFFGHKKILNEGRINFGDSGTFDDLKKRLDDLKNKGIDILYLNPIHMIGELYRNYNPHDQFPNYLQPGCPYSIKDYKSIDPELGIDKDNKNGAHASLSDPMKEFKELVKEAHKRNIKVFMDLVFNHTSHDFVLQRLHPEWFLYKENIKSLKDPYLYPEDIKKGKPWGDAKYTLCPYDHGYWWEDAAQLNWEYMLTKSDTNDPPKNPTLKEMYQYFKSIPQYWIKHFGIDGFRCDVAYRVPPDFWRECIRDARIIAKKEFPLNGSLTGDVVFIAESYCDNLKELFESGFSAVYGDYGNKLYSPLTLKGYLDYMYNISNEYFPRNSLFFIFPECHDWLRTGQKILGQNKDALLHERSSKSRWVLTATLPGIPMIFNGFEKLEWHPVNLFSYSDIDWESDKDLTEHIKKVNEIRNKHEALQTGKYIFLETNQGLNDATQIMSYARKKSDELMIIIVNMDVYNKAGPTKIFLKEDLGLDFSKKYILTDLLTGKTFEREGSYFYAILDPGNSHIFKVEQK